MTQLEQGKIGVGIIGAGLRGALVLGARLLELKKETGLELRAICDRNEQRMKEVKWYLRYQNVKNLQISAVKSYTDYRELVDAPDIDLIIITTPTYFHREPCEYALRSGKRVYLDKPIAVGLEDSRAIVETVRASGNPLLMGFTRRYEAAWIRAYEMLQAGIIGELMMMQLRAVIPYTRYYHFWHRRNAWSGGALNDKSSHHFDLFNWFSGSLWHSISGIGGQSPQFAPEENPPEGCFSCNRDCPYHILKDPDFEEMGIKSIPSSWKNAAEETERIDNCVFKPGADITDHAMCTVAYENGVKAALFLCIYGPKAPDQETFELIGTKGKILLTRHSGTLEVYSEYGRRHETIDCRTPEFTSSHFGADLQLVRQMRRFCDGEEPTVTVEAGHRSLEMVTAAQRSIDSGGALQLRG